MHTPSAVADGKQDPGWYAHAMERLLEVVQRLSLARDLDSVMRIVRRAARELTGADGATFVLRDGDRCFYADEDAIAPLWKGQRFPLEACISGWVMLNREAAAIEDIYADARIPAEAYRPTFVRSLAMVPIRTLDPLGAIGNYWASRHLPTQAELRVLGALADTTAVAMENLRVYAELEARVAQRTAALQAILDHVDVGIGFSVDARLQSANPKLAQILGGVSAAALAGRALHELLRPLPGDAAPELEAVVRAGAAGTQPYGAELGLLRLDDSPFWARVAARTIAGDSQAAAGDAARSTIWVVEDISVARARERALEDLRHTAEAAARFKSEFLASMSHELRTPLNAIMGFSEVLRDGLAGPMEPRQVEYVSDIYDSGEHLLELINDVLDLSKIEAGKMSLEREPVDLAQLARGCLSIVKEKAMAHGVTLQHSIPETLGVGLVDARKFKQIIYNLLSNAVKFTPDGGVVRLCCSVVGRAQAQRALDASDRVVQELGDDSCAWLLHIEVSDTGIGISPEDMGRLFEPFVQIDSSLSRQYQGTGLGLTLVRRLAALHGGTVGLRSVPGSGSTFSVWVPLYRVETPAQAQPQVPVGQAAEPGGPLALVIDDDAGAASLMRVQLENLGCSVQVADTAEQAMRMLREHRPRVIVLDVLLPGIDGWEFLARLKADVQLASIPVVVASIVADTGRGVALGAVEALQKPVPARMLREVLQRLSLLGPQLDGRRPNVLLVDDDPQALEVVGALLEANGCTTLRAQRGADALAAAALHRPDLVILDLLMPGMSGFEVIAALRADDATADIPVVILTAKALDAAERAMLQDQTCSIVHKSRFNEQRLLGALRHALARA